MKSKVSFRSHPLHPILVSFPITFFISAFFMDVLFLVYGNARFAEASFWLSLVAIVSALLAAVPGLIDYLYIIPPSSSAKKRGAKHGLLNTTVLLLFVFSIILKKQSDNFILAVLAEGAGIILLLIAGWLGGTLVVRNQIGIDHRYAFAGKWSEEYIDTDSGIAELKDLEHLKLNQMKLYHINGNRIVVCRTEKGFVAFDDRCSHRGASLADGALICGTVQCPWHGSQFDVHTGAVKAGPGKESIKTYKLVLENDKLFLRMS